MAAVIRMKRHISESPQTAFVLNCKKQKTDNKEISSSGETSTVLKFAGTVSQVRIAIFLISRKMLIICTFRTQTSLNTLQN